MNDRHLSRRPRPSLARRALPAIVLTSASGFLLSALDHPSTVVDAGNQDAANTAGSAAGVSIIPSTPSAPATPATPATIPVASDTASSKSADAPLIADPTKRRTVVTGITVAGGAVATSGTAERGHHLWDAAGADANIWASVTVIGPSLTWADAFATTACAMGAGGLDWVNQFEAYRAFAVTHDGELVNTCAA